MENIHMAKAGRGGEDSLLCVTENIESADESLLSKRFTRKLEPEHTLLLSFRRSRTSTSYRELFLLCDHGLYYKIPKHIISIDDKNVLGCLELICRNKLKAAACSFVSEVNTLSDSLANSTKISCRNSNDMAKLSIECPLPVGTRNVIFSSTGINSTITGSKIMDIFKSPSFNQFRPVDGNANSEKTSLLEICEPTCFEFVNTPRTLSSSSSSCKLMKEATVLNHVYASAPLHKRIIPVSSTNSTCSDQSSSSSCATLLKGMLQCTWKNGLPRYTFSMDDKREIFVADLFKVESPGNKVLDYVYTFHSMKNGSKECDIREVEPELVGKMQVSSSITFCSNNLEIMETRFVLFRSDDNNLGEMQSSSHSLQQNKRLTRKIVDVFKSTRSYKERSSSKFVGTSASFEDTYRHPSHQVQNSSNPVEVSVESQYAPNLELAAIVMRHHTCKNSKEAEIGGWGLKFLKRSRIDSLISSECCPQNCGECSTSMNIIVPADVHGGPKTRIGGPSSLLERWISGGRCDCGGWDIGCPLTILDTRLCTMEASPHNSGECKSFELFIQGSKQNTPIFKMVNIHEGLYQYPCEENGENGSIKSPSQNNKSSTHLGNGEPGSGRSTCSNTDVFEDAADSYSFDKTMPNLTAESLFVSPELYEFFDSSLPNIVKGCQWILLYRGANRYFYLCLKDLIALGGGANFALCLNEDLLPGTSGPCETFGNLCLAHDQEFELKSVELWGFSHVSHYLN